MATDASGIHGSVASRTEEVYRKIERLAALARDEGVAGVVLSTQHNFAWLTAGRSNRVDASRETGSASVLVAADGRPFVLASSIESPRVSGETLAGLDFPLLEFAWTEERADPAIPFKVAARELGSNSLGADTATDAARPFEPRISRLRATFDPGELPRYRQLAAEVGFAVAEVARAAAPGETEMDVARAVTIALVPRDIRPVVLLIGADGRIGSYRHPTPTSQRWTRRLLIAVCAEREGMVVAASRLVTTRHDDDLTARTRATARVYAALLEATVPGARGAELFGAAAAAYEQTGFGGEERYHHQGGAIAYRAREWVAHPRSEDVVAPPQAFAWNPTIKGTKIEETCVVHDDGRLELVTASPRWPAIIVRVRGADIAVPDVLVLGS